jgi:hypothetical protein
MCWVIEVAQRKESPMLIVTLLGAAIIGPAIWFFSELGLSPGSH